jgi:ElaB/YqjD/DUF883 family membrane-anchored ribosome-binding protein
MARTHISSELDSRLDSLKDSVKDLLDAGSERASNAKDAAIAQVNNVGKLIKAHPFIAIAIAVGIGYISMRLLRR